ncbi:hypothetical protein DSM07_05915 [Oenococcus sp. UCMA 16435]|nr:hypothetical protein DSM07_05915 [Oenococcus sp. UCMA 16435]MDI4584342.1 hypothetical protein [Oenococcus sp. UCMA 14587]
MKIEIDDVLYAKPVLQSSSYAGLLVRDLCSPHLVPGNNCEIFVAQDHIDIHLKTYLQELMPPILILKAIRRCMTDKRLRLYFYPVLSANIVKKDVIVLTTRFYAPMLVDVLGPHGC